MHLAVKGLENHTPNSKIKIKHLLETLLPYTISISLKLGLSTLYQFEYIPILCFPQGFSLLIVRSLPLEHSSGARGWLSSFGSERERPGKERKGWSITIHDLSGSPVAAASMVTPFVASPGSDRVSRSNPGCWLILRPGDGTWKPWGRLEAWRERGSADGLGYRFELIPDSAATGIVLADSTLSSSKGGKLVIDMNGNGNGGGSATPRSAATSPGGSPRGSGDYGYGLWPYCMYRGFVMSASVEGEGGKGKTAPMVEVGVQQVTCTEDAATFVALSAALDLSVDACRLFSHKLRKELCPSRDLLF